MAIPLLIVGFIQLSVGIGVYSRSTKDIARVSHYVKQDPEKIKTEELPRMEKVMLNFTIYKWIEIILIISAIILLYFWCAKS